MRKEGGKLYHPFGDGKFLTLKQVPSKRWKGKKKGEGSYVDPSNKRVGKSSSHQPNKRGEIFLLASTIWAEWRKEGGRENNQERGGWGTKENLGRTGEPGEGKRKGKKYVHRPGVQRKGGEKRKEPRESSSVT